MWEDGIYIGESREDFYLDYNNYYNFYDLKMLPILGNGINVQKIYWDKVQDWLIKNGYKFSVDYSTFWKWIDEKI